MLGHCRPSCKFFIAFLLEGFASGGLLMSGLSDLVKVLWKDHKSLSGSSLIKLPTVRLPGSGITWHPPQ